MDGGYYGKASKGRTTFKIKSKKFSDNPLVHSEIIDDVINLYKKEKYLHSKFN